MSNPHRGRLEARDVVQIDGVSVTSVARTVFDIARAASPSVAISAADSSMRCGGTNKVALIDILERSRRTTGHPRAQRIVEFADPRAESVGESICRLRMAQLGLPEPDLQVMVPGLGPGFDAWVDFEISRYRTVVEFDGRIKYGRLLRPGQSPGDVVFDEKRRTRFGEVAENASASSGTS